MAKYKNVSGVDRLVPHPNGGARLVLAGATHDDADMVGEPCQESIWQPVKPSKAADNDSQEG
jgi:hypothetical protein